MMTKTRTLSEVHDKGMSALLKTLGPVDMVRFLQMFSHGTGDHTKERRKLLKKSAREIGREIEEMDRQCSQ
jgi:hypothetical protein